MKDIIKFLKEKVISKNLITDELIYELEDGKLEGVYSDQITFSNLTENTWGFNFDMFIISNEKVYELDSNKKRIKIHTDFSGVSVFRFELAKRDSTNEVTGFFRLITANQFNQKAQAIVSAIYNVKLEDNKLSWKEEQVLYRDQPTTDKNIFNSVAFDSDSSFYYEDGKLVFDYKGICFDVNTKTLEKEKSNSIYPSFIAREK